MSFSTFDYTFMASALQVARLGLETSHPNPRGGCVITRDEQVVGRACERLVWSNRGETGHREWVRFGLQGGGGMACAWQKRERAE